VKLTLRITVIFLFLFVILLGAEAYFRLFSNCQLSGVAYDRTLGWRLRKNHHSESSPRQVVHFNGRGFRDRNHNLIKDPQAVRILILGDSYTAGLDCSDTEIFSSLLEYGLNKTPSGNVRYEIMNASVPAWATDQQCLYLKQEGLRYKPDFVILMVAPNDVRETYGKRFFTIENGQLKENGAPSILNFERFCWFLACHSCLFQHLQKRTNLNHGNFKGIFTLFPVSFAVGNKMCNERHLFLKTVPNEIKSAVNLFEALLLQMNRLCVENRSKFVLSVIPTKMEFDGTLNSPEYQPGKIAEVIQGVAAENGIPFLNLYSDLKSTNQDPVKIFISSEYHLNKRGHRFVAERLLSFFVENLAIRPDAQ
jgi:lysophospholipase L1-like esterase